MGLILNSPQEVKPMTARDTAERSWSHAYHDAKKTFKISTLITPPLVLAAFMASGIAASSSDDTVTTARTWMTATHAGIGALLAYTYYELQQKLNYLRDTFNASAKGFNTIESKLCQDFRKAAQAEQPSILEQAVSFRKYPFQALVSLVTVAVALATRQPAFAAMGIAAFMWCTLQEAEGAVSTISDESKKALDRIDFGRKNPGFYEKLEKSGKLDVAIETGVLDKLIEEEKKPKASAPGFSMKA